MVQSILALTDTGYLFACILIPLTIHVIRIFFKYFHKYLAYREEKQRIRQIKIKLAQKIMAEKAENNS